MANVNEEDEYKWLLGLQQFLYSNLLPLAEPNDSRRLQLVDQDAMTVWMITFTHESHNPNVGENYEELEKLGDVVMKMFFINYLMKRFPRITRLQLSELNNRYMSKEEQAPVAKKLGLQNWIRTPLDVNKQMTEDILEAVFGALLQIGDAVKLGLGYVLCYNLFVNIYNEINIDMSYARGHVKTQVQQLFSKLHWGKVIEIWQPSEYAEGGSIAGGTLILKFTPQALKHLSTLNIDVPSPILASADGPTKKTASSSVYAIALKHLTDLGITKEWADIQRGQTEFNHPEFAAYYPAALSKLRQLGYVNMYSDILVTFKGYTAQLIGVRSDNGLTVLTTAFASTELEAKKEALRQFSIS